MKQDAARKDPASAFRWAKNPVIWKLVLCLKMKLAQGKKNARQKQSGILDS
ncbi:Uncharacterised protein [Mobiluncus mulieris]|nr:Uncharacterised protein [Mobiluncus mulieris]